MPHHYTSLSLRRFGGVCRATYPRQLARKWSTAIARWLTKGFHLLQAGGVDARGGVPAGSGAHEAGHQVGGAHQVPSRAAGERYQEPLARHHALQGEQPLRQERQLYREAQLPPGLPGGEQVKTVYSRVTTREFDSPLHSGGIFFLRCQSTLFIYMYPRRARLGTMSTRCEIDSAQNTRRKRENITQENRQEESVRTLYKRIYKKKACDITKERTVRTFEKVIPTSANSPRSSVNSPHPPVNSPRPPVNSPHPRRLKLRSRL
eukprot:2472179-Pyramimonas_sp.AAC.2